eukprot:scaffold224958_cov35-Tisochrysis_lutea.AAC.1
MKWIYKPLWTRPPGPPTDPFETLCKPTRKSRERGARSGALVPGHTSSRRETLPDASSNLDTSPPAQWGEGYKSNKRLEYPLADEHTLDGKTQNAARRNPGGAPDRSPKPSNEWNANANASQG